MNTRSSSTSTTKNNIHLADYGQNQVTDNLPSILIEDSDSCKSKYSCECLSNNLKNISEDCNSDDEYYDFRKRQLESEDQWNKRDELFEKSMQLQRNLRIQKVCNDGACLFRAISLQIYGHQEMHGDIREKTMNHINTNRDYFSNFITENFEHYVERKRNQHSHGNHIEIQAISEIFNRPIELFIYDTKPIYIFNDENPKYKTAPLRLSYHRNSHYNAVIEVSSDGSSRSEYKSSSQSKEATNLCDQFKNQEIKLHDKLNIKENGNVQKEIKNQVAQVSYMPYTVLKANGPIGVGSLKKANSFSHIINSKNYLKRKSRETFEWKSKRCSLHSNSKSSNVKNYLEKETDIKNYSKNPCCSIKNKNLGENISQYHQSSLESSYTGNDSRKMSECEMIAKASQMSIACFGNKPDILQEKELR